MSTISARAGGPRGRALAIAGAATVVAVLLALGTWQLHRLGWKAGLIETMAARLASAPVPLDAALALPLGEREWRPVRATGAFLDDHFALYRVGTDGRPGYHILTPLALEGGGHVLVNRGVARAGSFKLALAALPPTPAGPVEVTGVLRPGETQGFFTHDNDPSGRAWFWIDLDLIGRTAGVDLPPAVIHADEDPAGAGLAGGQARFDPPNRHIEYAVTWYGLAAAAAVVFTLRLRRAGGERTA